MTDFVNDVTVDAIPSAPEAEQQTAQQVTDTAGTKDEAAKPQAESKPPELNPEKELKKALRGFQKRIDEATRARIEEVQQERARAEQKAQEAEYWRQQAEAFQKAQKAPTLDQFNGDLESHARAVAQFEAQRLINEQNAKQMQAWNQYQAQQAQEYQRQQAAMQYQTTVNEKLNEAVKKFPDFIEVVSSPELPGMQGTPAFQAILESETGAEVMYYLGKNPAKAHQIAALPPLAQVREIGRIEAAIQTGKTVSNAPPPPSSVNAGTGTATKEPRTVDEYYAQITKGRGK